MTKKKCQYCSKEFSDKLRYYGKKIYCSKKCGILLKAKISTCIICHKNFRVLYKHSGKYCSNYCHNIDQSKKIKHKCKFCRQIFYVSPIYTKTRTYTDGRTRHPVIYCSSKCRYKDLPFKNQLIAMNTMQQLKSPNNLEKTAYKMLDSLNIRYKKQAVMYDKFTVDALIIGKQIILQFDGDYWHGNPIRFPIPNKIQKHRIWQDKRQDAYLKKCGYIIIRWWEHDVYHNIEKCKQDLISYGVVKKIDLSSQSDSR